MQYPNLFKSRYPVLEGKDWIRTVDEDDRKAFIEIGLQAMDYGSKGGRATVKKHGKKHMKKIARIGGIASSSIKEWNTAVEAETERLAQEVTPANN